MEGSLAKYKFKLIRFFAMRQSINKIESQVRKNLQLEELDIYTPPADIQELINDPNIKSELKSFKDYYEF